MQLQRMEASQKDMIRTSVNMAQTFTFVSAYSGIAAAKDHIEVEKRRFVGRLAFDEQGNPFFKTHDSNQYVGDPKRHPEIEENWSHLIHGKCSKVYLDAYGSSPSKFYRSIHSHYQRRSTPRFRKQHRTLLGPRKGWLCCWVSKVYARPHVF